MCWLLLSGVPNGSLTHHPSSGENNFLEEVSKKNAREDFRAMISRARWKGKKEEHGF